MTDTRLESDGYREQSADLQRDDTTSPRAHDEKRIPDPYDHVMEERMLPCPCGAEILPAGGGDA